MRTFSKTVILLVLFTANCFASSDKPVRAKNGMVVSASEIASKVGIEIMQKGGNAIDASVAVGFALAVTYPNAGNLGGGGFMVIHLEDGKNTTIDFREKAPKSAHRDMYLNDKGEYIPELSTRGWTSVGVPGSVAGMIYALEEYGTMELEEVIQPAINIALNGFEIGYRMADNINYFHKRFLEYPSSKNIFTVNGDSLNDNHILIQNDLAKTLIAIKKNGLDGFYDGWVADLLVNHSNKNGGYLSHDDLEDYEVVERDPVYGTYRGHQIVSMGPPSSGGIAIIQTLNALENIQLAKQDWNSSFYIHNLTQILKHVYADRAKYLGDEDFVDVPKDKLLDKDYGKLITNMIGENSTPSSEIINNNFTMNESEETTHYSVVDSRGNAVSVTTTINSSYGNKIVLEGAGFLLNNEMDDFSSKPGEPNQYGLVGSEANSIQPEKRMLSSMSPTIILKDDKPYMVIGSPGGSVIITVVIQAILNVIDFEMDISEAISSPRIHHQWLPDRIDHEEYGLSSDVIKALENRGHTMGRGRSLGIAEGILIKDNFIWGATDPRSNGKAVGY